MKIDAVFGSPLPNVTISADRYLIRPFEANDLALIEEASRDELIPMLTTVPADFTPEEGREFIDRQNGRLSSGEGWSFAIVDQSAGRAVGQVGLWIAHLAKGRAEIGYWVVESARGDGAAAVAVDSLSTWAFENLDVDRLSLFIEPWNTASLKIAERAGFEREAILRGWERIGGSGEGHVGLCPAAPGRPDMTELVFASGRRRRSRSRSRGDTSSSHCPRSITEVCRRLS